MLLARRSAALHRSLRSCRNPADSVALPEDILFSTNTHTSNHRLCVGHTIEVEKTFTAEDVQNFLRLSGDTNPIHLCPAAARASHGMEHAILPGLLCASLFPGIIGTHFPGALYLSQTLKFRAKALVGEPLLARITVKSLSGTRAVFETDCFRATNGGVVVDGEAAALLGSLHYKA